MHLIIKAIDKETGLVIPQAIIDISKGKYDVSKLTNSNGVVRMKLNDSMEYTYRATASGYLDNTVQYSSVGKTAGEYSLNIKLDKLTDGKQFVLDDLYYDLSKSNIRPDAEIVLDKLAKILSDNPEVRIEIGSHTDSRATVDYNLKLSQRRSDSVKAYLISKGIAPSRLEAVGYGESQLLNKCADGIECTEEEHQANRRTVIEILNWDIHKIRRGNKNVYYR